MKPITLKKEDMTSIRDFFKDVEPFKGRALNLRLIYRGSRDGFNYSSWKPKV